jgi:hypothetical protein
MSFSSQQQSCWVFQDDFINKGRTTGREQIKLGYGVVEWRSDDGEEAVYKA